MQMTSDQSEIWTKWEPIQDVPDDLNVHTLIDGYDGLRLFLHQHDNPNRFLVLDFGPVGAYRNADEGDRQSCWYEIPEGGKPRKYSLFTIEHSKFALWLISESPHYSHPGNDETLTHYCIATDDDIVDVLSETPPKVFWTDAPPIDLSVLNL
ncbi:hypothetical protein OAU50_03295 [Planctomycetota bacterium]|nr:hypothetical protein [Planctomycetota bacterium]